VVHRLAAEIILRQRRKNPSEERLAMAEMHATALIPATVGSLTIALASAETPTAAEIPEKQHGCPFFVRYISVS
jgi:hypothetical protein